jgi:ABC-2 type transport system ATP-binding protein
MTVTTATQPVIRVRGLTKRYGDVQAVAGIDFDVAPGEIFGLLGPNGAGKTTTVEILEGLRAPDDGEVSVLGVDVTRGADELKPRIGVSLQTAALYPKLTVTELIDLFRSFYPKSRPTNELIDALELGERRNARSADLSGGQRQRLAVALSLVNDPELVFLDEPTTGLDPRSRRTMWEIIRELVPAGSPSS